jgi:hypothetical protein
MDLREIGLEGVDFIHMAQKRKRWWALMNTVMNLRVPQGGWFSLTSWAYYQLSRRTLLRGVFYKQAVII